MSQSKLNDGTSDDGSVAPEPSQPEVRNYEISAHDKAEETTLFKPIDGETSAEEAIEVESLCVNCGENGTTKLLLTMIPFYREVILSSFSCSHCSYSNNETQSAGEIPMEGVEFTLLINQSEDLNRKIVKSDFASVTIPELDLEIPALSQKGEVTTVEGILQRTIEALLQDQPQRKKSNPEDFEQIQKYVGKIQEYMESGHVLTLILRDTSGKSFVCPPSHFSPGQTDNQLTLKHFKRTLEEDHQVGVYPELKESAQPIPPPGANGSTPTTSGDTEDLADEVLMFGTDCSNCGEPCHTKMKLVQIPYFKEVIIMATDCDDCGHKTNEVKSGGGIEEKGKHIVLTVENIDDLSRDVLKAETCSIEIPCLELHVGAGTLGGKFTTLEGIMNDIKVQIIDSHSKFCGDSEPGMKDKMEAFSSKFQKCFSIDEPFTIIFDDPAGNSYIQNIQAPDDDPQLEIKTYERSFDQNEVLGLNDINTENY